MVSSFILMTVGGDESTIVREQFGMGWLAIITIEESDTHGIQLAK